MRIALGIQYNGSAFCGWQTQPDMPNVQDTAERSRHIGIGTENIRDSADFDYLRGAHRYRSACYASSGGF